MNRLAAPAIALAASLLALTGCSAPATEKVYEIGINQYVTHPALDAVVEGFKQAFADAGIKANFDVKNPQEDAGTNTTIAQTFASAKKDLVLGVATPSAQAVAQAITDIPVLFAAITDPVDAKLVKSLEAPGGNVTGTSDMNPIKEQLQLIKDIKPDAKSVAVLYTSGEANAVRQLQLVKEAAPAMGLTVQEIAVTNTAELQQAASTLNADALFVGTDNGIVKGLEAVVGIAEAKKIPFITADTDSVKRGALAAFGIDYKKLGYQTGQMAIKILKGEAKPATMPVEFQKDYALVINKAEIAKLGLSIPASWSKATDVSAK